MRILIVAIFWGGFAFLVAVAFWAVIAITRMQHEQAAAMGMLKIMAAKAGLQEAITQVQTTAAAAHKAIDDVAGATVAPSAAPPDIRDKPL
jgi:hypothetical protein